jgi:hypothetical protein
MFRWPKEDPGFSERFYQDSYHEVGTTELPDPVTLKTFIANNFAGSPRDIADQVGVLKTFLPQGRVLDFGCSWGYGVYQLKRAGYDAFGFDISRPRAELGRRELGVEILDKLGTCNRFGRSLSMESSLPTYSSTYYRLRRYLSSSPAF